MAVGSLIFRCTPLKSTIIDTSPANTAPTQPCELGGEMDQNYVNVMIFFHYFCFR